MPIIRYLLILIFFSIFYNQAIAGEIKKIGKFKDWETMVDTSTSNVRSTTDRRKK